MSTNVLSFFSHSNRLRQPSRKQLRFESLETRNLLATLAGESVDILPGHDAVADLQHVGPFEAGHRDVALHRAARTVYLPADSTAGLANAIAEAGPRGTVIVQTGLHEETGPVVVDTPVNIVGQPGAIIQTSTTPDFMSEDLGEATLYIKGVNGVVLEGLTFQSLTDMSNLAIRIEDARGTVVRNNAITEHAYGILVLSGDHSKISSNEIIGSPDIQMVPSIGITNIKGNHTRIVDNDLSGFDLGMFVSGERGHMMFNELSGINIGVLLCTFAPIAESPAAGWILANNNAHDNVLFGYLVTDFAHDNFLVNNAASNNGVADILLTGGDFPSNENTVVVGSHTDIKVIDEGIDNTVIRRSK